MTDKVREEVNYSAALDAFTYLYLDKEERGYSGWKLGDIIDDMGKNLQDMNEDDKSYYTVIKAAIDNDSSKKLEHMELISQSAVDGGIDGKLLYACTFRSGDGGDYYVAYRGTGDGKWLDNGEGLYKTSTIMQEKAKEYFDWIVDQYDLDEANNVIVTGHSKGGNSAQFAALASQNCYLIDSCYSFDGQGFSKAAIEKFQMDLQEKYQAQLDKMYSINGQNDPVHELGLVVIPEERTYSIKVDEAAGIAGLHALQAMIIDGKIDLEHLVEPGPVALFARKLSAEMMSLSDEDLQDCALSVMSLIERFVCGGEVYLEGTGDVKFATAEEFCGFIAVGIPLILKTAFTTAEGLATVGLLAIEAINGIASSENGGWKLAALTAVVLFCAPAVITLGRTILSTSILLDAVLDLFDGTFELSDIAGVAIIVRTVANAAMFLASNPFVVTAVLTIAAVVTFVTFITQHWEGIKAFMEAVGSFIVGAATAICAWAEGVATQAFSLIKSAVDKAAELYQTARQAILDLGNRLLSAVADFFSGIAQAAAGFLDGIASWVKGLFGDGTSALAYGSQIAVTMSYIEDLQHRIGTLRGDYLAVSATARDADGVISRVYSYYNESYVRSCCRDIQTELKNAQRYVNGIEQGLAQKRRALQSASENYRRSDQDAARDIHKFSLGFC